MKTFKLIISIILISACSCFAQAPTPQTQPQTPKQEGADAQNPLTTQQHMVASQPGGRMNRYMVQIPHTKEECQSVMNQMKEKGAPLLMRFDWGCASGDHTGYAI